MNSYAPTSSSQAFQYIFLQLRFIRVIFHEIFVSSPHIDVGSTRNLSDLSLIARSFHFHQKITITRVESEQKNYSKFRTKDPERMDSRKGDEGEEVEPTKKRRLYRDIRERMVHGTAYGTTFPPFAISDRANKNLIHICAAAAARITGYGREG